MPRDLLRIVIVAACVLPQVVVLCGRSLAVLAVDAARSQIRIELDVQFVLSTRPADETGTPQ